MTLKIQEKYDKHWEKSAKTNSFLYVAFVLDPGYNIKIFMYSLTQLFDMDTKKVGNKVEYVLRRLFGEYSLNFQNHGLSSSPIASSKVFKDCASISQPSICSLVVSYKYDFISSKTIGLIVHQLTQSMLRI